MGKNRNIKNIVKKRIIINSKGENIIKKTPTIDKSKVRLTNPPVKINNSIKIIDPRAEINRKKHINIPNSLNKHAIRNLKRVGQKDQPKPNFKDYSPYIKKTNVDFDVAICISSYNRYDKVKKIIVQLLSQTTKYNYKIFIMNDGSVDKRYNDLKKQFPEISYNFKRKNGGKIHYWKTVSDLWVKVKKFNTHALCQVDDDFILTHQFINNLMNKFFEMKKIDNGYLGFHYHLYEFNNEKDTTNWLDINNQNVDGGVLYDIDFIKKINYSIGKTDVKSNLDASNVWVNISNMLKREGGKVYRFKESLAFHNGNEDSKLNPIVRKHRKMNTKNFLK